MGMFEKVKLDLIEDLDQYKLLITFLQDSRIKYISIIMAYDFIV